MSPRATRYRAETLDQFLSFQTDNNDHQIRAVLRIEGRLDLEVLRAAVVRTLLDVPVLGCRYVEHAFGAYWEQASFEDGAHDFVTLVESSDVASDEQRFLAGHVEHRKGPQLLVRIVRGADDDRLCIVVNHMAFDGVSFERYLVTLGRRYRDAMAGDAGSPESACTADRGLGVVFRAFGLRDLARLAFRREDGAVRGVPARLPERTPGEPRAEFAHGQLGPSQLGGLLAFAHEHGVTLNDIVMAAYYSALWDIAQPTDGVLSVACMVDLRRYLRSGKAPACSNLASMVHTECGRLDGFMRTLDEVHSAMVRAKADAPGLSGLPLLAALRRVLPHGVFERVVKRTVSYPEISVTNLGVIPSELDFGTAPLVDAYVLTALKREPAMQLSFSTFRQTLTLSTALFASGSGIRRGVDILDGVAARLERVARP